ncbi:hypothetical protein GCM10027093_05550 [Paraburkholderia jirisanensis]
MLDSPALAGASQQIGVTLEHRIDMRSHNIKAAIRSALVIAASGALAACASLHPSPNGPGDCVGPPDYCVPYFGASQAVPADRATVSLASIDEPGMAGNLT